MKTLPLPWCLVAGLGTLAMEFDPTVVQSSGHRLPVFESIDGPQAKATIASAINAHGEIVGRFTDHSDRVHAFLIDRSGRFRTLDFPGALFTVARGVNDRGDVVGQFEAGGARHAFVYSQGKYVQLDFPGTGTEGTVTFAWGINNSGDIVGRFNLGRGDGPHGFLYSGGQWKRIDHPESKSSAISGISNSGEMVGIWFDANQNERSFRLSSGRFTSIDVPNATRTLVDALLDSGTVSGTYRDKDGVSRGYVMDRSGCVTTVDAGQYPGVTVVRGINAQGSLVGQYIDPASRQRGYILRGYSLRTC